MYTDNGLSGVGSHKWNDLEVFWLWLGSSYRVWLARSKKPNQPVSPVDWLETVERELPDTRKGSSEGQSPRGSFLRTAHAPAARISIISHGQQFVKQKMRKNAQILFPVIVHFDEPL